MPRPGEPNAAAVLALITVVASRCPACGGRVRGNDLGHATNQCNGSAPRGDLPSRSPPAARVEMDGPELPRGVAAVSRTPVGCSGMHHAGAACLQASYCLLVGPDLFR